MSGRWIAAGRCHGVVQVISVERPEWVPVFTGLTVRQFGKLVQIVAARGGEQTGTGRRWGLSLADRVLLVAVYYRTNLTYRQVAVLFGSRSPPLVGSLSISRRFWCSRR